MTIVIKPLSETSQAYIITQPREQMLSWLHVARRLVK